jgi:hypothetical protein
VHGGQVHRLTFRASDDVLAAVRRRKEGNAR